MARPGVLLAALAAALALTAAGCGGGGTAVAQPLTAQGLSGSAARSAEASSGRFAFEMTTSMPGLGDGFGVAGEGSFDTASGKTQMTLDLSALLEMLQGFAGALGGSSTTGDLDPDDFELEAIADGAVVYLRFPFLAEKLPGGKEWVKVDARRAAAAGLPGVDVDQLLEYAQNGPHSMLAYLQAVSGQVETVGTEEVRGTETTHYRATVDLRKHADLLPAEQREALGSMLDQLVQQTGLSSVPVDVWIGGDGLVRRLELTISMSQAGSSETASAGIRYEMFDYGEPVTITLPLPEDTADVSTLAP